MLCVVCRVWLVDVCLLFGACCSRFVVRDLLLRVACCAVR